MLKFLNNYHPTNEINAMLVNTLISIYQNNLVIMDQDGNWYSFQSEKDDFFSPIGINLKLYDDSTKQWAQVFNALMSKMTVFLNEKHNTLVIESGCKKSLSNNWFTNKSFSIAYKKRHQSIEISLIIYGFCVSKESIDSLNLSSLKKRQRVSRKNPEDDETKRRKKQSLTDKVSRLPTLTHAMNDISKQIKLFEESIEMIQRSVQLLKDPLRSPNE